MKITIFSDGASQGNPGPGGFGVILIANSHRKELSQGFRKTTNNRMELLGIISGLEALKKEGNQVEVYTDSQYVVNAVEKAWVFNWVKKGFRGKKNEDLWRRFLSVYQKHKVKLHWIKGHAGHPENERCDELAVMAANSGSLLVDHGFENQEKDMFS